MFQMFSDVFNVRSPDSGLPRDVPGPARRTPPAGPWVLRRPPLRCLSRRSARGEAFAPRPAACCPCCPRAVGQRRSPSKASRPRRAARRSARHGWHERRPLHSYRAGPRAAPVTWTRSSKALGLQRDCKESERKKERKKARKKERKKAFI